MADIEDQKMQLDPPGSVTGETPALKSYWDEAYAGLDEGDKNHVKKLKRRFNEDTKTAIRKLASKTSDHDILKKLMDLANGPRRSNAGDKGAIQRLDVGAKRKLQLLASATKKKLKKGEENSDCPDAWANMTLQYLNVSTKGKLQLLAWSAKKELDVADLDWISTIHEACLNHQSRWSDDSGGDSVNEEELLQLCRERQEIAKQKSWKFNFLGRVHVVHELWASVVGKVNKLKPIIDVAASTQPTVNTVWSIVKAIIQFAVQGGEAAGSILAGIDMAVSAIQRCTVYDRQVRDAKLGNQPDQTHIEAFESCLISTYGRILKFLSEAGACLGISQPSLYWHAFWSQASIVTFESEIFKFEQKLFQDSVIGSMIDRNRMAQQVLGLFGALNTQMALLYEQQVALSKSASDQTLTAHRAGKTVLMSRIIDHHLSARKSASDTSDFQLAYFYCKYDAPDRRFSHDIFRSFIRQLADGYYPLPEKMRKAYDDKSRPSSLSTRLNHKEYRELLLELIPRTTETILILDALDECVGDARQPADNNEEMRQVLRMFRDLLASGLSVKLIVSSRYDSNIEAGLGDQDMIEILPGDNRDDILKMVQDHIDGYNKKVRKENKRINHGKHASDQKKLKQKPEIHKELKDKMLQVFINKSQGKFQWASMHIQYLLGGALRGPGEMEAELGKLPPDLTTAYDGFFDRIRMQSGSKPETALRVFRWLLTSHGSCEKGPLIAATCQKLKGDIPDPVEGDEAYVLMACQNLVISDNYVFQFSHSSVQEYTKRHRPELIADCHYDVALVCVWTVFRYKTQEQAVRSWAGSYDKHPVFSAVDGSHSGLYDLWNFAASNWHHYFRQVTDEAQRRRINDIVTENFASDAPSIDSTIWIRLQARNSIGHARASRYAKDPYLLLAGYPGSWINYLGQNLRLAFPSPIIALHAIISGFMWKTRRLFYADLTVEAGLGEPSWAIEGWQCSRLYLYGRGPWFHQRDTSDTEPHHPVPLTLSAGTESYSLADLPLAASDLCKRLELNDYNVREEELTTLLSMLSHFEKLGQLTEENSMLALRPIIERMTEERFERNTVEELARLTLLLICADMSAETQDTNVQDFVEYLLEEFPCTSQVRFQHLLPMVEFLDWSSVLGRGGGSLEKRLLDILISHGADVNAVTPVATPLISAVALGNVENTKYLLLQGADVNMKRQGTTYGTALIAGCAVGDRDVLKILLDIQGIEVNAIAATGDFATALIAACAQRQTEIVKWLLQRGAFVNVLAKGGTYATALFAAADSGCVRAVRILLKSGASEVPGAVRGGWKRSGARNAPIDDDADDVQSKCRLLVEWLNLGLVRGIQDEEEDNDHGTEDADQDIGDGDTSQSLADDGDEVAGGRDLSGDGENESRDSSDRSDSDSGSSEDESDDEGGDGDGSDNKSDSHHAGTANGNQDTGADEENASRVASNEEPADDDNSTLAAVINKMTRRLNESNFLNSRETIEALIESFGYSSYGYQTALAMGFRAMLQHTDKQNWRTVKESWSEFLDLAEEAEGKHIMDPLVNKLMNADVRAVRRMQSVWEAEPLMDEEWEEGEWEDDGDDESE